MITHTAETIVLHPQHVVRALTVLGNGFVAHPHNHALRAKLDAGRLDAVEYYAQLTRLLYRVLFVLTAEAQGVLPSPQASAAACQRYLRSYSLGRLQHLAARRRGAQAMSLYRNLWAVMEHLGRRIGNAVRPGKAGQRALEVAMPS